MGRPPKNRPIEQSKSTANRVQIKWKNIHTGTGVKLTKGMILELNDSIFDALADVSKDVGGNDIDAIKLVDDKKALTHKIIIVDGNDQVVKV